MRAYSADLRERVARAVDDGGQTREEVAQRFGVTSRWVRKLLALRRQTGSVAPRPHAGGRKPAVAGPSLERLRQALRDRPDATLEELRQASGTGGGVMAVWRALRRLKVTRKKSRCGPGSSSTRRCRPSGRRGGAGWPGPTPAASGSSTRARPGPT